MVCDRTGADVLLAERLDALKQHPPLTTDVPLLHQNAADRHTTVIVHISSPTPGPDGWTGEIDYVAALTCTWLDAWEPSPDDVAASKLAGRYAAAVVHQAQQAELIRAQQKRIASLPKATVQNTRGWVSRCISTPSLGTTRRQRRCVAEQSAHGKFRSDGSARR